MRTASCGRVAGLVVAVAAVGILTACTIPSMHSPATHSTSAAPTAPVEPLSCEELAPQSQLVAALDGEAIPGDPVKARLATASSLLYASAVEVAGGLQCDWTGAADPTGLRLELSIQLLPDPDARWTAMLFADGPSTATDTFGSHTVTATAGDPGYGVTARIGSTWVFLVLWIPPEWVYASDDHARAEEALAQVRPFIQSLLDTVENAAPAQLRWPAITPRSAVTAETCGQYLKEDRLRGLIGTSASYEPPFPLSDTSSIGDVAADRADVVRCRFVEDYTLFAGFDVVRDAAPLLASLRDGVDSDDISYTPVTLAGQPPGGWAISGHRGTGANCADVIFTLGDDIVDVYAGPDPKAIAEAILGQAF